MAPKRDCGVVGDGLGIAQLPEWTYWRRALIATGVLQHRLGQLIKIWMLDGVQQRCDDQFDVGRMAVASATSTPNGSDARIAGSSTRLRMTWLMTRSASAKRVHT